MRDALTKHRAQSTRFAAISGLLLMIVGMWFLSAPFAAAAEFTATPAVIDGKGKVREILKYTVTLENRAKRLLSIYPWVSDLDAETGKSASSDLGGGAPADERETNLSRWIEVTRGVVDLLPGEKKEIPVLIQVHPSAPVGHYHAFLRFSPGGSRADAEANVLDTVQVAINIEVLDDARERLQVGLFSPMRKISSGGEAVLNYRVENIGNRGIVPGGKIIIYDGDGKEVAELPANKDGKRLEPSEKAELAAVWASGGSFGRYKAKLELEYGDRGVAEDTIFFWVLPWHKLLGMFGALIVASVLVALFLHSRSMAGRQIAYAPEGNQAAAPRSNLAAHKQHRDFAPSRSAVRNVPAYPEGADELRGVPEWAERFKFWKRRHASADELVEINIPPPTRTTLRRAASSGFAEGGVRLASRTGQVPDTHKVHLSAKPRATPDPRHVVKLKK